MFPFESYNGLLKSFVVAPTDILHQVTTRYICYRAIEEDKCELTESNALQNEEESLHEIAHIETIEKAGLIRLDENGFEVYSRFRKSRAIFTSRLYSKAKKTTIFFVETVTGELGAVELYVLCNGQSYAILEKLNEIGRVHQFIKFRFSNEYSLIRAENIVEKCIHIKVPNENFLVKRPNTYERN